MKTPSPPVIKPLSVDNLALPDKLTMPNGIPLYMMDSGVGDVLRIDILMRGGYAVQQLPLQAMFTNRMIREGTKDFNGKKIVGMLDYYGAWIDMYSSQNCNHITLYTLNKHLLPLLGLLESMLKRPLFPQSNLDIVRSSNKAFFVTNNRKVDVVAQRHFENALWGDNHKLGHIVCAEDYDAITREALSQYYSGNYGSDNMTIFLSGRIEDKVIASVEMMLGTDRWGGDMSPHPSVLPPVSLPGRRNIHIDGSLQSGIKVGCMLMDADDSDFQDFRFLTVLLGGYFGSRLMSSIREEHGYTYHIEAELDAYGKRNAFMISTETANEYVAPLFKVLYSELERLRNEPVSQSELELVRNYTIGELCREYEGISQKAEVFINVWLSGQPFESVNRYLETIRTITPYRIQELACKYLDPEKMIEVVAGL